MLSKERWWESSQRAAKNGEGELNARAQTVLPVLSRRDPLAKAIRRKKAQTVTAMVVLLEVRSKARAEKMMGVQRKPRWCLRGGKVEQAKCGYGGGWGLSSKLARASIWLFAPV